MNRLIGETYIMVKGIDNAAELAKAIAENNYQVVFYENEENGDVWTVSWCDTLDGDAFCELTEDEQCEIRASRDNVGKADITNDEGLVDNSGAVVDNDNDDDDDEYEEPNEDGPWYDDDEHDESNEKYPWDD